MAVLTFRGQAFNWDLRSIDFTWDAMGGPHAQLTLWRSRLDGAIIPRLGEEIMVSGFGQETVTVQVADYEQALRHDGVHLVISGPSLGVRFNRDPFDLWLDEELRHIEADEMLRAVTE